MTITSERSDRYKELLEALDEIAEFKTKVYADDDRVWQELNHPHDNLAVRVFVADPAVFQLYNHRDEEVIEESTAGVSEDPQAVFKEEIESIYHDWRKTVL